MKANRVDEVFGQMDNLLKELRSLCGVESKQPAGLPTPALTKAHKSKKGAGPAKPIVDLLSEGFFSAPKTFSDLMIELRRRAQIFDKRRVATTLNRMTKSKVLKREGDGKGKNPWKYKSK